MLVMNPGFLCPFVYWLQSYKRFLTLQHKKTQKDIIAKKDSRTIDALMLTDSRHNAIYQYGMLRVVYRFNILGGKNNLKAEKKDHDEWDGDWGDWGGGW